LIFDFREDYEGLVQQRPGTPTFLRRPLGVLVRKQIEWAARNCDAVVVADQGTADLFQESARRIVVLHNFPRLDLFPYKGPQEGEKSFDIVNHGSMTKIQLGLCLGIDDALMQQGNRVRWRLITKGGPDMDWLRTELARRGAQDRFTIDDM